MVDYCRHYASTETADLPAFTHVTGEPGHHQRLTFQSLDVRARAIAAEIQRRGGTGKPVLVVLDPGVDYAASLFGCLYARAIAVPVYPPQMMRLQQTLPRLKAMVANAGAKCMLGTRAIIGDSLHPMWQMDDSMAIAIDEINEEGAAAWDGVLPKADDVAILQYTSGSTGNPRGVVLPHRVLISNLKAVIEHYHFEGANSVQWVPPYHDMGLIGGIFVPIFRGVEAVVISPMDFVKNPLLWLQCIDHYNGTSNGSPNFGYELCVRKIKDADCQAVNLDLSSWKVAIAGAEPVRAATLRAFCEKFGPYGFQPEAFCPAFGMAETTVVATAKPFGQLYRCLTVDAQQLQLGQLQTVLSNDDATATKELVGCGVPVDSMDFEIVDPQTLQALPDGQIGEIWVYGDSVATGYWNNPEATANSFNATLANDPANDPANGTGEVAGKYLRTGDLGSRFQGELFVTGRLKELIIINGRNLYPHDIEEVVQSVSDAFRTDTGTAFSIETDEGEQLVIVQELWRPGKFDAQSLLPEVVAAVLQQTMVTPHAVVLVPTGSLPKTSSGKLRRTDTKNSFLSGKLNELARWASTGETTSSTRAFEPPITDTEHRLSAIWTRLLNHEPISRHDDFFHLGGGSLLVGRLLTEVAETFDREVTMTTFFQSSRLSALAAVIDSEAPTAGDSPSIPVALPTRSGHHLLSHAQRRFWLLDQLGQTNAFLHVPVSVHLEGTLDRGHLESALTDLVGKHPMLRARLVEKDGDVFQTIQNDRQCPTVEMNPADLRLDGIGNDCLLRVGLHHLKDQTSRIDFVFHHMICDATSIEILLADLQAILAGEFGNRDEESIAYTDYAAWDRTEARQASWQSDQEYWHRRLDGMPSELNLPSSARQPSSVRRSSKSVESGDSFDGLVIDGPVIDGPGSPSCVSLVVDPNVNEAIEMIAMRHGWTESMVYLTVFQSVLARFGDGDDFAITIPTSNRPSSGLNQTVGCFVNPLPYRATVDLGATLVDAIESTKQNLLADLDHADIPFHMILSAVDVPRTQHRMPLSQVMFLYQPAQAKLERFGDLAVQSVRTDYSGVTAYDLSLVVQPGQSTLLTFVAGDVIDAEVAKDIRTAFELVLHQIATNPDGQFSISELSLNGLSDSESVGVPIATNLVDRLTEHARTRPEHIAVADDRSSITYAHLNESSDRIARGLLARDIQPDSLIGVELPRSLDLIVVTIGIWKAGCAYLPLEPSLPRARRTQIFDDAQPEFVIDSSSIGSLLATKVSGTDEFPLASTQQNQLAYVMYTSGSTGKPKGVAVEHGNVSNLLESFSTKPGFGPDDSMLAVTTMAFDISVLEMFLPIWSGGTVRLTAHRISTEPEAVASVINDFQPTVLQSTPSAFGVLLSTGWKPSDKTTLLCGGEPLLPDLAEKLLASNSSVWNVYGPTETTVWSTMQLVESSDAITIGHPILNTDCRVVDRHGLDAPPGVTGELWIGGAGVARGYFDDDAQTSERFVNLQGKRYYRTGDQVLRRRDGQLDFLARNDRQVKLRGFRVELDEIESALQRCRGVSRAAVILSQGDSANTKLIAFCATKDKAITDQSVRSELAERLPDYMIPTSIVMRSELPQTTAGKTDYKTLASGCEVDAATKTTCHEPAQGPIEQTLAEAWCGILERNSVGRHDHFFDLGGNSLMAAQLFSRLRQKFDVELRLREIYQRPTIAELAEAIMQNQAQQQADQMDEMLSQLDSISEDEALQALEKNS